MALTLPAEYVSRKFAELGYKAEYHRNSDTWVCSCPICLEGKSYGKKKRCFYIPQKDLIYCHNCGWSSRPLKWIMTAGGLTYRDILNEVGNKATTYQLVNLDLEQDAPLKETREEGDLPQDSINLLDDIQVSFYKNKLAVKYGLEYLEKRRLKTAINAPSAFYVSLTHPTHKGRLIVPFCDVSGRTCFYQSRAIGASGQEELEKIRYLSKKNSSRTCFNLDKVDTKLGYLFVFEGPFDSCFIKNGIAVAGINTSKNSDFTPEQRAQLALFPDLQIIWCLDSQWKDDASKIKSGVLLRNGECVFIWPKKEGKLYKDFNDMAVARGVDEIPVDWVLDNALCGQVGLTRYKSMLLTP